MLIIVFYYYPFYSEHYKKNCLEKTYEAELFIKTVWPKHCEIFICLAFSLAYLAQKWEAFKKQINRLMWDSPVQLKLMSIGDNLKSTLLRVLRFSPPLKNQHF